MNLEEDSEPMPVSADQLGQWELAHGIFPR